MVGGGEGGLRLQSFPSSPGNSKKLTWKNKHCNMIFSCSKENIFYLWFMYQQARLWQLVTLEMYIFVSRLMFGKSCWNNFTLFFEGKKNMGSWKAPIWFFFLISTIVLLSMLRPHVERYHRSKGEENFCFQCIIWMFLFFDIIHNAFSENS
jgi:hypothetical protein